MVVAMADGNVAAGKTRAPSCLLYPPIEAQLARA